ncbi:hypothetical protein CHUAL_003627 [Chamberlinius hualienensis]
MQIISVIWILFILKIASMNGTSSANDNTITTSETTTATPTSTSSRSTSSIAQDYATSTTNNTNTTTMSSNSITTLNTDKPIDSGNVTNNTNEINHGSSPTSFKYNNATLKPIHVVAGEDIILKCNNQRKSTQCQWFRNESIVAIKDRYSYINHTYLNDSLSGTNTTFCSIRIKNITTSIDGHNWRCEISIDDQTNKNNTEVVIEYQLVYQLKSSNGNSTSLTANSTAGSPTTIAAVTATIVIVGVIIIVVLIIKWKQRRKASKLREWAAGSDVTDPTMSVNATLNTSFNSVGKLIKPRKPPKPTPRSQFANGKAISQSQLAGCIAEDPVYSNETPVAADTAIYANSNIYNSNNAPCQLYDDVAETEQIENPYEMVEFRDEQKETANDCDNAGITSCSTYKEKLPPKASVIYAQVTIKNKKKNAGRTDD